jgi:hypothetical protein
MTIYIYMTHTQTHIYMTKYRTQLSLAYHCNIYLPVKETMPIFLNPLDKSKRCIYGLCNTVSLWKSSCHSCKMFCTLTMQICWLKRDVKLSHVSEILQDTQVVSLESFSTYKNDSIGVYFSLKLSVILTLTNFSYRASRYLSLMQEFDVTNNWLHSRIMVL